MISSEQQTLFHLQYTEQQRKLVELARRGHKGMAAVDDLDPTVYDMRFMRVIACGRGANPSYGFVDDLDPAKYSSKQAVWVSRGRAPNNPIYAPIDDLDPRLVPPEHMEFISRKRRQQKNDCNES